MAQATVTITYDDPLSAQDADQHSQWMYGKIAVQAGPATYATGGLGTGVTGAINWAVGDFPKTRNQVPQDVVFYGTSGFVYVWNPTTNKFQVFASTGVAGTAGQTALSVEMSNAFAIPAAVSGDVIRFEARFLKSI